MEQTLSSPATCAAGDVADELGTREAEDAAVGSRTVETRARTAMWQIDGQCKQTTGVEWCAACRKCFGEKKLCVRVCVCVCVCMCMWRVATMLCVCVRGGVRQEM